MIVAFESYSLSKKQTGRVDQWFSRSRSELIDRGVSCVPVFLDLGIITVLCFFAFIMIAFGCFIFS